jgi:hypothetical protein
MSGDSLFWFSNLELLQCHLLLMASWTDEVRNAGQDVLVMDFLQQEVNVAATVTIIM